MSKYIEAVKSANPEHLYVLDVTRADLDTGSIEDQGSNPVAAAVVETGTVGIEPVPALIDGLNNSLKFNVVYNRATANAAEGYGRLDAGFGNKYFGTDTKNFLIELVVHVPEYNRSGSGWVSAIGSPIIHTMMSGNHGGFSNYRTDDENFRFVLRLANTTENEDLFLESQTFESGKTYHVGLLCSDGSYSLYVNGEYVDSGNKTIELEGVVNQLAVGGFVSARHSDSIIQSVAFFDRACSPEKVKERYGKLTGENGYIGVAESLAASISIIPESDGSEGAVEPELDSISVGTDSRDFYEDENEELMIQPSELAVGVSKTKTLKFDLSDLSSGVSSYFDMTTVTDANSSIAVEYSFYDVAYSVFAEGENTVPELDANWGGVV